MSFWNLSDGKTVEKNTSMEMVEELEPIPSNTQLLAVIDEAKIDSYEGMEYISFRWSVLQPAEYKNRKIFQKVRVYDADKSKADKAKRMLAAIDTNAGGQLMASGQIPNDTNLTSALCMKQMVIKVQVWDMNDKKGNWVSAVAPKKGAQAAPVVAAPTPVVDDSDSIPF